MSGSPKVKKTTTNTTTKTNQSSPSLWANVIYQINTQSRQLMKERISLSSPSQSSKKINKTIDNNDISKQPIPMWRNNKKNNNNDDDDNDDDYGFSNSGYDDNDDYDTQSDNHSSIQTESIINSSPILSQDTPYKQKTNNKSTNLNNKNENENESESESEYIEENENNSDCDTNSNFIGDSDYNDSNLFTREDSENENDQNITTTTTTTQEIINKNIRKPRKPRQSLSSKSGLVFPVSRVHSILKSNKFFQLKRISKDSVVYLTAVLQYLCEELLLLSIQYCIDTKKKRIGRRDILKSIELDNEYRLLFDNLIVNSDSF
ncbi:hypothetical protein ACTFIU_004167 [Dictyostelium citrinum]